MRCRVENCIHNESGFCAVDSYVEIYPDGSCSEIFEDEDDEYE